MTEEVTLAELRELFREAYGARIQARHITYHEEFQAKALLFIAERLDRLTRP